MYELQTNRTLQHISFFTTDIDRCFAQLAHALPVFRTQFSLNSSPITSCNVCSDTMFQLRKQLLRNNEILKTPPFVSPFDGFPELSPPVGVAPQAAVICPLHLVLTR